MQLSGLEAFRALSEVLSGKIAPESFSITDISLERLRQALIDKSASSLDRTVLLRQVLIGEKLRLGSAEDKCLPVAEFMTSFAENVGLQIVDSQIRALPWQPSWLKSTTKDLGCQAGALVRRRFDPDESVPIADPFFQKLGHNNYRSGAQRAAIRSSLLAPPGSTTAIVLPTGEGKSKVFQAIDEIGFASDSKNHLRDGVTLVVVPTVALAYDHERNYRKKADYPLAYVGSSAIELKAQIRNRIEKENHGLVFVAPEVACQSLRPALLSAARVGRLKALVIDEAHLIDAWGTGFRTEFQNLSGLRRELITASPENRIPRTLLLSATLTPETLETLKDLFTKPGDLRVLSAGQLRPEPDYWVAQPANLEIRNKRVIEALYKLPRPAILYVTEVAEAKKWEINLRELGYSRLTAFHGKTPDETRRRTLNRWQDGSLDLVVATSAFGLGIDFPHVRTVVHACVPETLDRFYQEVGRAGRDGCASISLVIPSFKDFKTASSLNKESVLSIERGLTRWKSMFDHPDSTHLQGTTFRLRTNVAPGHSPDNIDLVGERSLQWNARLLSLLSRAGLIRLGGTHDCSNKASDKWEENYDHELHKTFVILEILENGHLNESIWRERVEPVRKKIGAARKRNLQLMLKYLREDHCPSDLLLDLYGRESLDPMCSECAVCRENVESRKPKVLRSEPIPCWSAPPLQGVIETFLQVRSEVIITYDANEENSTLLRRWAKAFDVLWESGLCCLSIIGKPPSFFQRAMDNLRNIPVFVSYTDGVYPPQLPDGPRVVVVGAGYSVNLLNGTRHEPNRLLIIPDDMRDTSRPGECALDKYSGLVFDLGSFLMRQI